MATKPGKREKRRNLVPCQKEKGELSETRLQASIQVWTRNGKIKGFELVGISGDFGGEQRKKAQVSKLSRKKLHRVRERNTNRCTKKCQPKHRVAEMKKLAR